MSYDVFVMKFAEVYSDPSAIPETAKPQVLGTASDIRAAIDDVFSGVNWADPAWGDWESDLGSIEFNIGADDPVGDMALHIRAEDAVMAAVVALCRNNGWQAMDGEDGFIEQRVQPAERLNAWRAYRDPIGKS